MQRSRYLAGDGRELEGQRRDGPGEPHEHAILEALDIDLEESRTAVVVNETVEGQARHGDGVVPDLALPPRRSIGGADEIRRSGRDRRVGAVDVERQRALRRTGGGLQQDHRGVAAVDQPDRPRRPGLRLEGDDTGAEAAEGGDAVADMGADVEGEIAGFDETGIERVHGAVADGIAIVDLERAPDRRGRAGSERHAQTRRARISAGGSSSSGMPHSAWRLRSSATSSDAVKTAKGIATR